MRIAITILLIATQLKSSAQTNLVLNGNFEEYINCPSNTYNKELPKYWYSTGKLFGGYLNSCSNDVCYGIPSHCIGGGAGYQMPFSGNGYALVNCYRLNNTNIRLYIQSKLKASLKANHCYKIELFVNLYNTAKYGCNNLGLLLTNTAVYVDTTVQSYPVLPANPQIVNYGNPIITDTLNWVKVSAIYTAQGGEQYITIGNFSYDNQTQHQQIQPTGYNGADYYVDDVSVIPLDSMPLQADAGRDTSIKAGDSVFIGSLTNGITNITWYNSSSGIINTQAPGFYVTPSSSTYYVVEQTVCGNYSRDTVYVGVVLPLKFISYSLLLRGTKQSVQNTWQTTNEINVSHYNIERSLNAKDFVVVGKVKANNKSFNEYNFTDLLTTNYPLLTPLYYRVVGVDNDGKLSYSEVRKLVMSKEQLAISIFPNPAKGLVHILIPSDEKAIWTITVQDVLGKVMSTTQTTALTKSMDIQVSNQRGMYFITLTNTKTNKRFVEKILVE